MRSLNDAERREWQHIKEIVSSAPGVRRMGNKQSERPRKLTDAHSSFHLELIVNTTFVSRHVIKGLAPDCFAVISTCKALSMFVYL